MKTVILVTLLSGGFSVLVGRHTVGKYPLDVKLDLDKGVLWAAACNEVKQKLDELSQKAAAATEIQIIKQSVAIDLAKYVSEIVTCDARSSCSSVSKYHLEKQWKIVPSFGETRQYWAEKFKPLGDYMLDSTLHSSPRIIFPVESNAVKCMWLKTISYEVKANVSTPHGYETVTLSLPILTSEGNVVSIYGFDDVCRLPHGNELLPNEENPTRVFKDLKKTFCHTRRRRKRSHVSRKRA
ncbi:hypothetical protein DSO57_1005014 [Entomophthora muscae]|uniref:Uncharacterized protein n=1 Tax=Entomophthora muscae TaxID=34485 RepID=A0ACC2TJ99_9FUNG|nr:hypothetical protein DSO57_1005014 [Entomophthora muscae]